jgi:hypothetical protein
MPAFDDMELDARPDWNELEEHTIAKKNLVNKLTNIKAPSLKNKAKGVNGSVKNCSLQESMVGTNSSQ